jgi:hypothetical protein
MKEGVTMALKLSDVINQINELSDEQEAPNVVTNFVNDAIAEINVTCQTGFPEMVLAEDKTFMFPDKWVRMLIIPYGVGRVKQKDSSQFEYMDAYGQFMARVEEFRTQGVIPREHKELPLDTEVTMPDNSTVTSESGDTLYTISVNFNVPLADLKADNTDIDYSGSGFKSDILETPPYYSSRW